MQSTEQRSPRSLPCTAGRVESIAIDLDARHAAINQVRLRADPLAKVRAQLVRHGYRAALLSDPPNIRYATGSRNIAV